MSEQAAKWARQMTATPTGAALTGPEAHLLLLLATCHSEIGGARWPTIEEQCAILRLHERRVQWLNSQLEGKGCIRRNSRGGRGHATSYELLMPVKGAVSIIPEDKGCSPDDTLYMEDSQKGAVKGAVKGAATVPDGGTIGGSYGEDTGNTSSPSLSDSPKTRAAKPEKAKKQIPPLGDITEELVLAYADRWTADEVKERIDYALNHAASKKWLNRDIGLRRWLKRDADSEDERRGNRGTSPPQRNGTGPPAKPGMFGGLRIEDLLAPDEDDP